MEYVHDKRKKKGNSTNKGKMFQFPATNSALQLNYVDYLEYIPLLILAANWIRWLEKLLFIIFAQHYVVRRTIMANISDKQVYHIMEIHITGTVYVGTSFLWIQTQTLHIDMMFEEHCERLINKVKNNNQVLGEENDELQQQLREKDELIKEMIIECERLKIENRTRIEEKLALENKLQQLKERHGKLEKDYEDKLLEFERLSIENDSKTNKAKGNEKLQKLFPPKQSESLVYNMEGNLSSDFNSCRSTRNSDVQPIIVQSEGEKKPLPALSLPHPSGEQSVGSSEESVELSACQNQGSHVRQKNVSIALNESIDVSTDSTPFPTEVHERSNAESLGLINETSSSVSGHVYNAYKLLLLTISGRLLYSDIIKLKEWAKEKFSVESNLSPAKLILQLDQKGAINASDLGQLRVFFESITRFDLVYLIDEFYNGDYDKLRKLINQHKSINNSRERVANLNREHSSRVLLPHNNTPRYPLRTNTVNRDIGNVQVSERPSIAVKNNGVTIARNRQRTENAHANVVSTNSSIVSGNRFSTYENSEDVPEGPAINNTRGNQGNENRVSSNDAPVTTSEINRRKTSNSGQPSSQKRPKSRQPSSHDAQNRPAQCNGPSQRHRDDHFHGPRNGDIQDNWLCNHYKRRCLVKFDCCSKYWPCHRCHNNESTCGRKKLKSRDTTMVKCVECGKEQQFGENGQFCVSCNTQFANFYCGLCKHLTGNDDHPYHCDKCGICRIHGDRSFHCDVCGICLDVQLRGNHKCRPDSAHDECGICLEDAFTGCQILPCSHKVHKECANRMIRNGITCCPICRESFAHKLERRPVGRRKR
ncbi:RING finger and CHY zinc finger domain-containing 1 [Paramuricea clavata]|uniref:RING finger and CHY zinc finger domain-containing 1 n=1 Tax=Paramuricea clavata TaxID=317549 RepID=A0A6S7KBU8_PARCT|nr:RING finger and CHY zinc finger domain-containing 1 [Paramuricea clavata]